MLYRVEEHVGRDVAKVSSDGFGQQTWIRTRARKPGRCAVSGYLYERNDWVWRPSMTHAWASNAKHRVRDAIFKAPPDRPRICAGCGYFLSDKLNLCIRCGHPNERLKRPA